MMFHSIGALSGSPGLRFLCNYFLGAPSNPSGVNYSLVTDGCSCWGFILRHKFPLDTSSFLLKRTTFRLAYASHLQVFKLSELYNYLVRDLMYT